MSKGYVVKSGAGSSVIPAHSIYEYDTITIDAEIPKHQVGDRMIMSDGRVFHYALNGGVALGAGALVQNAVTISGHQNMTSGVVAIGETTLIITPATTNMTKNYYANGYAWVNIGTGYGQCYKIKSHLAITLSVVGYMQLYDPIIVALDATSKITVAPSPWKGTIILATTISGIPVGVPLIAVPATTATIEYYYWAQTWGPCCILAGGTQVITTPRQTVGHDAGAVIVGAAHGIPDVGWLLNGLQVTDAEYCGTFLRISQ